MPRPSRIAAALLCLIIAPMLSAEERPASKEKIQVQLLGGADDYGVVLKDEGVVINLVSKRGIGRCTIKRHGMTWPKSIKLVIHIGELEGFTVANEKLRLQTSRTTPQAEVFKKNNEGGWDQAKSQKQHRFSIEKKEGEKKIRIQLPAVLLTPNSETLQIQWVDWYR